MSKKENLKLWVLSIVFIIGLVCTVVLLMSAFFMGATFMGVFTAVMFVEGMYFIDEMIREEKKRSDLV